MHTFTPKQINAMLDCLNRTQPQPDKPACILNHIREVVCYALLPTKIERIDDAIYMTLPGTNLILIARPTVDGRTHWSGLTKDGTIYNNDLVELVNIFLNADGRERKFLVDTVAVENRVIWVAGRCDFSLNGGAR